MAKRATGVLSAGEKQKEASEGDFVCGGVWGSRSLMADIREKGSHIQLPRLERGIVIRRRGAHTPLVGEDQNLGLP